MMPFRSARGVAPVLAIVPKCPAAGSNSHSETDMPSIAVIRGSAIAAKSAVVCACRVATTRSATPSAKPRSDRIPLTADSGPSAAMAILVSPPFGPRLPTPDRNHRAIRPIEQLSSILRRRVNTMPAPRTRATITVECGNPHLPTHGKAGQIGTRNFRCSAGRPSLGGADMVTATPDTFLQVLNQVFNDAMTDAEDAAKDGPDKFKDLLDKQSEAAQQAIDQVKKLPQEAIDELKQLLDPPDWWSILVYAMTRVADLDPRLSLGVVDIADWERMLTLTFTPGVQGVALTLGLALVHPKPAAAGPAPAPKTRGLMLRAGQGDGQALHDGSFSLSVTSAGNGTWFI